MVKIDENNMKNNVRLKFTRPNYKICEHINTNFYVEDNEFFNISEYVEIIFIECKICKKIYGFKILVN